MRAAGTAVLGAATAAVARLRALDRGSGTVITRHPAATDARPVWLTWVSMAAAYLAIVAVYILIPLGSRFADHLLGTSVFAPDAVLNLGILEYGLKRLTSDPLHFFDWTAGFPLENMLAGTEHLLGWQLLYAPLRLTGLGPVAAYNVLIISSLLISAVGAALLARQLGADLGGAWIAGFVFAFAPFHLSHAVHLQTLGVCWSPFAVLFLDRLLGFGKWRDAVGLGVAYVLSMLCAMYFAAFLLLVLSAFVLVCYAAGRHPVRLQPLARTGTVAAVTAIMLMPIALPYLHFAREHGFQHAPDELMRLSLAISDLIRTPAWIGLWGEPLFRVSDTSAALPGVVALTLFGTALLFPSRGDTRSTRVMLLALTAIFLILSLGPILKIRGNYPSRLADWLPMPGQLFALVPALRMPSRIFFYSLLFGAILAGFGTMALSRLVRPRLRILIPPAVAILLALEYLPHAEYARSSVSIPEPIKVSGAYAFLAAETDRGGVVELPISDSTGYGTALLTRYVYGSAGHGRRVVAFHGNVRPRILNRLQEAALRLPDATAQRLLVTHGVTRLVIHPQLMPTQVARTRVQLLDAAGYPKLYQAEDAVVFALIPTPTAQ